MQLQVASVTQSKLYTTCSQVDQSILCFYSVSKLLEVFRKKVQQRGVRGLFGLARLFKIMDDDQSKTLSRAEFEKACRDFKTELSSEDVGALFSAFDLNKDGVIQYDEFLRVIRGDLNDYRRQLVQRAFKKLDRNNNGVVEIDDLVGVYNASKHPAVVEGRKTAEQVLGEFLETFETHHNLMYHEGAASHDQTITEDEFIEYYTNVSTSIDDDIYFSQMINASWNLTKDASPYQMYERGWANGGNDDDTKSTISARPQTAAAGSYQRRDNQRPSGVPTLRSGLPSTDFPFDGPQQFYSRHGSPPRQSLANLKSYHEQPPA